MTVKPEVRILIPYLLLTLLLCTISFLSGIFYQSNIKTEHNIKIIHQDSLDIIKKELQRF